MDKLEYYKQVGQELLRRCFVEHDAESIGEWLRQMASNSSFEQGDASVALMLWDETFQFYDELLEKRKARAALPPGDRKLVDWPWTSWNKSLDPLEPGMLCVISAPDGGGKTAMAETLGEHWVQGGLEAVYVHFELNREIMFDRRTARNTSLARTVLRNGVSGDGEEAYLVGKQRMLRWPGRMHYLHTPGWTMERVTAALSRIASERSINVVIIDYLEKASASPLQLRSFGGNKFAREADDVEQLKSWAEQHNLPVVCLAQMNKSGKSAGSDIDRTAIRGAGEKTEKANMVILIQRDQDSEIDVGVSMVKCRIDKNTLGPTPSFTMRFEGNRFAFFELHE